MINKTESEIMKNWKDSSAGTPIVSVRCLTYNHEKYIGKALDGFLMQETDFPFEVVVHDDASTDRTADIIKEYEKRFPHIIKPIYEEVNQYSKQDGSIRRIMNNACKGKYLAPCEGDDFWTDPRKLQSQFDCMERHPECTIAFCRIGFADADGVAFGPTMPDKDASFGEIFTLKEYCEEEFKNLRWAFHTSSFFFRKEMKDIAPELYAFPWGDMRQILHCLTNGKGLYIDKTMGLYRAFSGGYITRLYADSQFAVEQHTKVINALQFFDSYTEYKYSKMIQNRIRKVEYELDRDKGQRLRLLSSRYKGIVSGKQRIKDIARITAPGLYGKLKTLKNRQLRNNIGNG